LLAPRNTRRARRVATTTPGQRVARPAGSYGDARRERDPLWLRISNHTQTLRPAKGRKVFLAGHPWNCPPTGSTPRRGMKRWPRIEPRLNGQFRSGSRPAPKTASSTREVGPVTDIAARRKSCAPRGTQPRSRRRYLMVPAVTAAQTPRGRGCRICPRLATARTAANRDLGISGYPGREDGRKVPFSSGTKPATVF
jgi:hypothetical protein